MKKDKKRAYAFERLLLILIVTCAFTTSKFIKLVLAGIILIGCLVISFMLRKEKTEYTNFKSVTKVMIVFGILYLALFYVLGIYVGYYKNVYTEDIKNIFLYTLPTTIIIIGTEIIRNKLLSIKTNLSIIVVLIITTLIDVVLYVYIYDYSSLGGFLSILGFITFSAIANNLLYNYLSPKYGYKGIVCYKLITTLYLYLIPYVPDVYVYFRTFFRMIYPLIIYSHIEEYYNPDKEKENIKDIKRSNVGLAITFVITTLLICLISCKFSFGTLVIGSGSMTGSLNKGDVVLFKKTRDKLEKGDIIVFKRDKYRIVHRIVEVTYVNGKYRYYTKGDKNQQRDDKYVKEEDLMGKVVLRIKEIGKPSLWLREQFEE